MKKYIINYSYDKQEDQYVAVCPQFFGFVCYGKNFKDLKQQCINILKIYSQNESLNGTNIDFNEFSIEEIYEVEMGV